ncbi:MAG: hypothetical protein WD801_16390 [Gemmatimonadaceae bacterium]
MASQHGSDPDDPATAQILREWDGNSRGRLSDELLVLLRERVHSRYYEDARVIDTVARRLIQLGSS